MKLDSVLSLFAQKMLLGASRLPDQTASPLMLAIDKDIIWHGLHQNDEAWKELFDVCDRLASNEYPEFCTDESDCIVQNQPDWKLGEWREKEIIELPSAPVKKCDGADERCSSWRMELLAYYSPAHFNTETPHLYGIHFTPGGIASAAQSIRKLCPKQPKRIVQLAAAYTIFAHEMCHAWIEDICTINDVLSGNSTAKLDDKPYYKTQRKYNSYIFVEEALCNTAALSLTKKFLEYYFTPNKDTPQKGDDPYNSDIILHGIKQWMKGQPRGYRDFIEIPTTPSRSKDFLRALQKLLVGIYGLGCRSESNARAVNWLACDRELITAIQDYFCTSQGCDTAQVLEGVPNTALHSPWTSSPPIHFSASGLYIVKLKSATLVPVTQHPRHRLSCAKVNNLNIKVGMAANFEVCAKNYLKDFGLGKFEFIPILTTTDFRKAKTEALKRLMKYRMKSPKRRRLEWLAGINHKSAIDEVFKALDAARIPYTRL